jgi:hypothetical protein
MKTFGMTEDQVERVWRRWRDGQSLRALARSERVPVHRVRSYLRDCGAAGPDNGALTSGPSASGSSGQQPLATTAPRDALPAKAGDVSAASSVSEGGAAGAPQPLTADQSTPEGYQYWNSEWCHFYFHQGQWYGDVCVRPAADPQGQAIAGLYNLYAYPGAGNPVGNAIQQYSTTDPGHITFRDLQNPLFTTVQWARSPSGTTATPESMEFMVTDTATNQSVWIAVPQLLNEIAAGNGARYGFAGPALDTGTSTWMAGMDSGTGTVSDAADWGTSTWATTQTSLAGSVGVLFGQVLNQPWVQPNCSLDDIVCDNER